MSAGLDPLRASFLGQAAAVAERRLADAAAEGRDRVAAAERKAAAIVAAARREGEEEARRETARGLAAAERRGRELVLQARRDVYDAFRREAHEAARALRDDPAYPALLERLARAAATQLGEEAQLERDPPGIGGVRAREGRRAVDYSLDALADRCLDTLGADVEELWR